MALWSGPSSGSGQYSAVDIAFQGEHVDVLCQEAGSLYQGVRAGDTPTSVWDQLDLGNGERAWINDFFLNTPVGAGAVAPDGSGTYTSSLPRCDHYSTYAASPQPYGDDFGYVYQYDAAGEQIDPNGQ